VTGSKVPALGRQRAVPGRGRRRARWSADHDGVAIGTRPLSDPGALGRIAPFAAVAIVAVVLAVLPPASLTNPSALVAAAALSVVLITAAVGLPWARLPGWTEPVLPLTFFAVVVLLRQAAGGAASGYAPLVLLPILWIALYGSRTQLRVAIGCTVVTFGAPLVLVGAPAYPGAGWRGAVLWVVIGQLAGTTIQSLVDHARQRTADIAALGAATRALTAGSDPRPQMCAAARLATGAAFAVLFEPQPDGTLAATACTDGLDLALMRVNPVTEVSAVAQVWRTGTRIYVPDAANDPRASARLVALTGAVAVLFQPVIRDGTRSAVLVAGFHESRARLPERALEMVELVAAEIAAAIDRADLVALLATQARTDPLTGAANRRSWDEELERQVARMHRTGEPLTVALLDMDHFKAFNDAFGHGAGDGLLRDLVAALRGELRTGDVVARWGGEEFAVALPGCTLFQAQVVAARLLSVVPGGQTASIGLTAAGPDDTPRTLIGRADRALYEAKDGGRNQVKIVRAPTSPATPPAVAAASA
jgi:diguanylate cyclase (GGDEF)-like protein